MTNALLVEGARNLLAGCAALKAGESLLLVEESPAHGWYDAASVDAVAALAGSIGARVTRLGVGAPGNEPDDAVENAADSYDVVVFFARIGDQERFSATRGKARRVMCYARDAAALASAYGRTPHRAMTELVDAIDAILAGSTQVEIRCPAGTRLSGRITADDPADSPGTAIRRFPLGVHRPLGAGSLHGRVALTRYLTPTGSAVYEPPWMPIEGTVYARIAHGRIAGFDGEPAQVREIENHYHRVAERFGIDARAVHSFHAGTHPACTYAHGAARDPDRWSNSVFTHPRFLHFHTCGNYAPGEICWMLADHRTSLDGTALWDRGRLNVRGFEPTRQWLSRWPALAPLVDSEAGPLGLDGASRTY